MAFIDWSRALEGAQVACQNARRLADDALRLHDMQSFLTAFSISILAWEETNKAGLLLKNYIEKRDISKAEWFDKFSNHKKKLEAYPEYYSILYPNSSPPGQTAANTKMTEIGRTLDLEKQHFGFYTDFVERSSRWFSPTTLSTQTIEYATWLGKHYATQSILTCLEIEEHIKQLQQAKTP